jgi:glycosyltransferase involved in cell wall biosynthesis
MKTCIIIPVYNSENQITNTIENVIQYADNLIVVNDGSTDRTLDAIRHCRLPDCRQACNSQFPDRRGDSDFRQNDESIEIVSYEKNRGKGYALKQGFKKAMEKGFTHAVTIDADGQHLAKDIVVLTEKSMENPDALIVGSRKFNNPNMPEGNRFANNFSNFWFAVQTGKRLPDTQTGFRVYPLQKMGKMRLFTNRYETELEILVRCAWKNVKLIPQLVNVYYPPKNERFSHFRKGKDFFRISILNTILCVFAVIYGFPSMFLRKVLTTKNKPQNTQ